MRLFIFTYSLLWLVTFFQQQMFIFYSIFINFLLIFRLQADKSSNQFKNQYILLLIRLRERGMDCSKSIMLIAFLIYCTVTADAFLTKVIHNTDPEAKCLDGSSPMIYLHQGGDTKNILFYFLGGGSCADKDFNATLQNCYQRSKGQFGTSKVWPDTYSTAGLGILQADPSKSRFANWTKIGIMYCDGAFHQGNNKSPFKYKDTQLFFRGAVNTRSHFKWADNKYGLAKAERILVTGSSAGGIATFLWIEYVKSLVPDPKKVFGIADSGIFYEPMVPIKQLLKKPFEIQTKTPFKNTNLHHKRSLRLMSNKNQRNNSILQSEKGPQSPQKLLITRFSNVDEKTPNKECSDSVSAEQTWYCLFIQFSYNTLRSPILFIESQYDANIIPIYLSVQCITYGFSGQTPKNCSYRQLDVINIYRNAYLDQVASKLLQKGHSLWSISCSWHAEMINSTIYDSDLQRVPQNTGLKMKEAVEGFVFEGKRINSVDYLPWPYNKPCAF